MAHLIRVEVVLTLADDLTAGSNSVEPDELKDAEWSAEELAAFTASVIRERAGNKRARRSLGRG